MSLFCLIDCAKGSKYNANKSGDQAQPCLFLLCRAKLYERQPLTLILAVGLVNKAFTVSITLLCKPNFKQTFKQSCFGVYV